MTFIFQFHVTVVWFLFAWWPFSRLVHAWSIPVDYLRRSPIPYRDPGGRAPASAVRAEARRTRRRRADPQPGPCDGRVRGVLLGLGNAGPDRARPPGRARLSDTETSIMISIPVVLGSLLRIPLGQLTDRRRQAVFTVMIF